MNRFPRRAQVVDGYSFPSMREARRYGQLAFLLRAGEISRLEVHPEYPVEINDQPFTTYTADFRYRTKDGKIVIEDVKSTGTKKDAAYRLRKKACELYYGITVDEIILSK